MEGNSQREGVGGGCQKAKLEIMNTLCVCVCVSLGGKTKNSPLKTTWPSSVVMEGAAMTPPAAAGEGVAAKHRRCMKKAAAAIILCVCGGSGCESSDAGHACEIILIANAHTHKKKAMKRGWRCKKDAQRWRKRSSAERRGGNRNYRSDRCVHKTTRKPSGLA